jgi:hypothetical protein
VPNWPGITWKTLISFKFSELDYLNSLMAKNLPTVQDFFEGGKRAVFALDWEKNSL